MRLLRFFSFLFVAALSGTSQAQDSPPATGPSVDSAKTVTATFWNVQWFPGRRPNASPSEENRQIRAVQRDVALFSSDIVALEEVRDAEHAALTIQPLNGFKVDVCSNFPTREGQTDSQQIAITSRLHPIAAWAESWQRRNAVLPPRGFAFGTYQVAPDHILLAYALHLKSNHGEVHEDTRIREESIHQLLKHIQAMNERFGKSGKVSWIIGGDFNTAPDEPRFAREKTIPALLSGGFRWGWEGIPFSARITMPSDFRYPPAAFDQIFYRGATLVRAWVEPTSPKSSDHRAVSLTLKLP